MNYEWPEKYVAFFSTRLAVGYRLPDLPFCGFLARFFFSFFRGHLARQDWVLNMH